MVKNLDFILSAMESQGEHLNGEVMSLNYNFKRSF